ncbi:thiomuracin/GE37468 family thiazolyl RiPP peptide [Kitasatospora sp. NPDC059747]|uniref:thiomuracin/GE37468 family thiazolyl RiPP peptide n=1 Tax=unclassified Kitasatospora TaxID=2633591 RepID=UPI00364BB17C
MENFDNLVLDDSAFELVELGEVVPASVTAGYGLTELSASKGTSSCCCCTPCCSCT